MKLQKSILLIQSILFCSLTHATEFDDRFLSKCNCESQYNKVVFQDQVVYQFKEPIEKERVMVADITFKEVQVNHTVQYDTTSFEYKGGKINNIRLLEGLAPIGIDGQEIQLCRLSQDANAPIYEIHNSKVDLYLKIAKSTIDKTEACVTYPSFVESYWKARK